MAFTAPCCFEGKVGVGVSNRPRTSGGIHLRVTGVHLQTLPREHTLCGYHSANTTGHLPYEDTFWETAGFLKDPLALDDEKISEKLHEKWHMKPLKIYPVVRTPRWTDLDDRQVEVLEGTRLPDPTLEAMILKEKMLKRNREKDMEGLLTHHCFRPPCLCGVRSRDIVVPPRAIVNGTQVDSNIVVSKETRQQKVTSEKQRSSSQQPTQKHSLHVSTCVKRESMNAGVITKSTRHLKSGRLMDCEITQQALCAGFELFDFNGDGFISRTDFLRVLHEFGFTITIDELDNLLSRNGQADQVKYKEFLSRCYTDIKAVNLAGYTEPRQSVSWIPQPQVNTNFTPLIDQHVQDVKPNKDPKLKSGSPRILPEIEAILCNVLKKRSSTFNQHFKNMTWQKYGRIDKLQFGRVLTLCSVFLLECELDHLWISLPTDVQNMLSYSELLDHFLISLTSPKGVSEEDSHLHGIVMAAKKSYSRVNATVKNTKGRFIGLSDQSRICNSKDKAVSCIRMHSLCGKVKGQVQSQRDYLMTYFQTRDRKGLSHISRTEMKMLMDRLYFNLTAQEKEELCQMFDFHNRGRFHYVPFMESMDAVTESQGTSTAGFP
ncbi:uncharacterized protein LOC124115933 [Haliotis rufescens]|uniref:uncharacterized protein LOC124115933 n=1 Tax=Haliotis rufescens TaxID=6454 RepID=UPI001EAFB1D9|nr:uncharacterized protein LOC124115933 [Haliotis rufescens]